MSPYLLIFSIINGAVEKFPLTPLISPIVNNVVNTLMVSHSERFIERRTVGEVINGRKIGLLDTIDIIARPLRMLGLPIPEYGVSNYKLRDNRYGFLAMRNNTNFGPFEMYTGMESKEFAKYATYLNKQRLGIYRHQTCDALNGTDGAFFGSYVDKTQPLYLFNMHACRSFRMQYSGDSSVNGVSAYRYEFGENLFDGPVYNRENWCFCPKNVEQRKCHGLLDLSQCLAGVPFALTFPHFLNSPRFLRGVKGLDPDREKHLGFFDIEPTLGITLRGSGRFQINLKLRPFTFVPGLSNFKQTLLPYLWLDEGALVEGWLGFLIKAGSYSINGANYAFLVTIFLGTGIALLTSVLIYKKRGEDKTKKSIEPLINPNMNSGEKNPLELNVNGLQEYNSNNNNSVDRSGVYIPPPRSQWNKDFGFTELDVPSKDRPSAESRGVYPDLSQMNDRINTIANTIDMGVDTTGHTVRKISIASQGSNRSVIDERHSGLSHRSEVLLPPVENGETHTTVIIQRKPYPNEMNRMNYE